MESSVTSLRISENYEAFLKFLFVFFRSNPSNMTHGYFNDVYIKPWSRLAPYAIGLAVGYVLCEVYQRSNTLSWDRRTLQRTSYSRYHYFRQILTWILALTLLSLCVFGTYGDYSGHPLTRVNRIAFLTLARLGWSIGLCVIIIACFAGHGGRKRRFDWIDRSRFSLA